MTVATRKLNYRFHDPNPPAEAVNILLQICIDANRTKVEAAMKHNSKFNYKKTTTHPTKPLHTKP